MTTKITLPDGTICGTGPTCQRHAGSWNPAIKLDKAMETNTFAKPKENDVENFYGDKVVPPVTKTAAKKTTKAKKAYVVDPAVAAAKEEALKKLHDELQGQVSDLQYDANWKNMLDTMSQFHNYSYGNNLIIRLQNPNATRVAGYNKWKDLGRQVKKGETALRVFAPIVKTAIKKDSAGNPVIGPDGKPVKNTWSEGFTTVPVFDISQTEGKELPSMPILSETPPDGFITDMENAAKSYGYTVEYRDDSGQGEGYTSQANKLIVVSSKLNEGQRASVLAHELGHVAAGHVERQDEYHTGHNGQRSSMEVEAESISYVLCRANGMTPNVGTQSKTYVAGWAKRNTDPEIVKNSADKVSKTVKSLLEKNKWKNAVDLYS